MLLVALEFLFLFWMSAQYGIAFSRFLRLPAEKPAIVIMTGLFAISLIGATCAFWIPLGRNFCIGLIVLSMIFFAMFRKDSLRFYADVFRNGKSLTPFLKGLSIILSLLILAKCATLPFLPDNESYYIQTIKWLNGHGWMRGLANLHFFFGQSSGWHVTQAALNLSFWYDRFNDLSGFALLAWSFWGIGQLRDFFADGNRNALIFGLTLGGMPLWMQFIAAPSPDLPVYFLSLLIGQRFVSGMSDPKPVTLRQLFLLTLFALFIKLTALPLLLFPMVYAWKLSRFRTKSELPIIVISSATFVLFVAKNLRLTGYPLFPLPLFQADSDYAVPNRIISWFAEQMRPMAFDLSVSQFEQLNFFQSFLRWLTLPGLHGLLNSAGLLVLIIAGFVVWQKKETVWRTVYYILVVTWIFLFAVSPQYRFGLGLLSLAGMITSEPLMYMSKTVVKSSLLSTVFLTFLWLLVPMHLGVATQNTMMQKSPVFTVQWFIPEPISSSSTTFSQKISPGLIYNAPDHPDFFWFTGNGPLPCVNTQQLEFMETHFGVRPILRNKVVPLKFKSVPVETQTR